MSEASKNHRESVWDIFMDENRKAKSMWSSLTLKEPAILFEYDGDVPRFFVSNNEVTNFARANGFDGNTVKLSLTALRAYFEEREPEALRNLAVGTTYKSASQPAVDILAASRHFDERFDDFADRHQVGESCRQLVKKLSETVVLIIGNTDVDISQEPKLTPVD